MTREEGHHYYGKPESFNEDSQDYLMVLVPPVTPLIDEFKALMKDQLIVTNRENLVSDLKKRTGKETVVVVIGGVEVAEELSQQGYSLTYIRYGKRARWNFLDLLIRSNHLDETIATWMKSREEKVNYFNYREFIVSKQKQSLAEMVSIIAYQRGFDLRLKID